MIKANHYILMECTGRDRGGEEAERAEEGKGGETRGRCVERESGGEIREE